MPPIFLMGMFLFVPWPILYYQYIHFFSMCWVLLITLSNDSHCQSSSITWAATEQSLAVVCFTQLAPIRNPTNTIDQKIVLQLVQKRNTSCRVVQWFFFPTDICTHFTTLSGTAPTLFKEQRHCRGFLYFWGSLWSSATMPRNLQSE